MGILDAPALTPAAAAKKYARRDAATAIPALSVVFPNPMTTPPTITAVSTGSGAAGITSPITGEINFSTAGFVTSTAATKHVTLRNGGSYAALTQNSVGYWQFEDQQRRNQPGSIRRVRLGGN